MSHVYGHSCVTLEVHMCQESLSYRRVCVCLLYVQTRLVCGSGHISLYVCVIMCVGVCLLYL